MKSFMSIRFVIARKISTGNEISPSPASAPAMLDQRSSGNQNYDNCDYYPKFETCLLLLDHVDMMETQNLYYVNNKSNR